MSKIYKIFFLHIFLSFSFFVYGQKEDTVVIIPSIPKIVKAGNEFVVQITIHKGEIKGFARFLQNLPQGFTAIEKNSENGHFNFQDQKLTISWMELPMAEDFSISYIIRVAPTTEGYQVLNAEFSYLKNGKKRKTEAYPNVITVKPSQEAEAAFELNTKTKFEYGYVKEEGISCIRQKPYLNDDNEVIVNLLVIKGILNQFGKIQENIPAGYKAESISPNNAIFIFNPRKRIVKFMWMTLPEEEQFVVSYKLVPVNGIPDEAFIIEGNFSYAENNSTNTVEIVERNIDLLKEKKE